MPVFYSMTTTVSRRHDREIPTMKHNPVERVSDRPRLFAVSFELSTLRPTLTSLHLLLPLVLPFIIHSFIIPRFECRTVHHTHPRPRPHPLNTYHTTPRGTSYPAHTQNRKYGIRLWTTTIITGTNTHNIHSWRWLLSSSFVPPLTHELEKSSPPHHTRVLYVSHT